MQATEVRLGVQGRMLREEDNGERFRSCPDYLSCAEFVRAVHEAWPLQTADFDIQERRSCSGLLRLRSRVS